MKILMISSDPTVLEDTATAERIEEYRRLVDELYFVVIAGKLNVWAFFRAYRDGARILRERGPEGFLITAQDPSERWLVAWLLARAYRAPLEVQVHTDIMSPYLLAESVKNKLRLRIAKFILPRSDCIRVVSRRILQSLTLWNAALAPHSTILPIYVDVARFRALHRVKEHGAFRFLMVSRLTREKNIALAIHAFAEIAEEFRDAKLIIVGDGPYRKRLEALALAYKLMRGRVVFEGWQEDVSRQFQYASCYLMTSYYEGYGRAVVEALAAGLPVIMTDVGVAGEIVENEKSGLIVPVGDKQKLVHAMKRIMADSYLRRSMYENCRTALAAYPSKEEYLCTYKNRWLSCGRKNIQN
jgi:glycosyltransferase involved in cell wall biosynthesis